MQYTDVDLAAEGGYLKPMQKEFMVTPTGPNMIIELKPKVQHPILNGIEIYARETEVEEEGAATACSALPLSVPASAPGNRPSHGMPFGRSC